MYLPAFKRILRCDSIAPGGTNQPHRAVRACRIGRYAPAVPGGAYPPYRAVRFGILLLFSPALLFAGCGKDSAPKPYMPEGIRVNKESLILNVGDREQLTASVIPAVAHQPTFQWSSANDAVVTVAQGWVEAIASGETTITVGYSDVKTKIPVKVTPREQTVKTYTDTIIRMTLRGADCPFADHADYGVYIPTRTESLRGILILQHGCGMEQFGITRPYDIQYQAFARKWKLAVIETALYGNCGVWRDPEAGTANALLKVLNETGEKTGHPELNTVPWLLFGHSGGGYWTLAMLRDYPERIMAAVCYSPAFDPQWDYPVATAKIPVLTRHAGANDGNDAGVLCWATSVHAFEKLRRMDAPVSIAHNPEQNHNYSYLRYMSIPFYEAVMKQRMPEGNTTTMRDLDRTQTWLGDTLTLQLYRESTYTGDKTGLCVFPDEATAKLWKEYVSTGTVADKTPPPAPFNVKARWNNNVIEITWEADADIESGILRFEIFKNDALVGRLPETDAYQRFDTNGDNAVPAEVPEMKFRLAGAEPDAIISVRTVNHFNLPSERTISIRNDERTLSANRLFYNQRSVNDPVNQYHIAVNCINNGKASVVDMTGVVSVFQHIAVGRYGKNTGIHLKSHYFGIYAAQKIFGGNGRKKCLFDIPVNSPYVFIGLMRNFDNHSVILSPKSSQMASSKFFLNSSSESSSSSGTGRGVLSGALSTMRATRGCFSMSRNNLRPVRDLLSITTVVIILIFYKTAQRYK
jgi:pimeloyl-ACP methyl ester carboxylesterase